MSVLNARTNRQIKIGSRAYKQLVRDGKLTPVAMPDLTPSEEPILLSEQDVNLEQKLAEAATDILAENIPQLKRSTNMGSDEMDALLKKLLIQKLSSKPGKAKPVKPKKVKPVKKKKKKAKKKYKIVEPESESESESSESESESD